MSNSLAIAAVTSTIRYVLERSLQATHLGPVGGARVTTLRPSELGDADLAGPAGINVFCYLATPNHAWNLDDLPTRRSNGSLASRPVAAVDLHYLLTCYGQEESLDAQRLLGRAIVALKSTSVLTRDVVDDAMTHFGAQSETAFLTSADLADEVELVKLSPVPLSLEEMSKLWGVLDASYQLSLTYLATVVLISASALPTVALPVQARSITLGPARPPQIRSVATDPAHEAVTVGSELVVTGSGLVPSTAASVRVGIGPAELVPASGATSATLRVTVDDTVPAGVHGVNVQHRSIPGAGASPPARVTAVSNRVPVVVQPTVSVSAIDPTTVTLAITPALQSGQEVSVLLTRLVAADPDEPSDLTLLLPPLAAGSAAQHVITLRRADLALGTWLVRVQVDGVQSVPGLVDGVYATPALTLA
ncbi:MAG: DUF4255 domain-containing protein [Kineosporiaceae bacterium]